MTINAGNPSLAVQNKLADLAKGQGISLAALSRMIGRNPTYLQQYITKGSPRKLEEGDRLALAEFFGVAESELGGRSDSSHDSQIVPKRRDWIDVPRLPLDASAGPGAMAAEETPFDAFRFSSRWLREQGLEAKMLSAISVAGDSMEPLLRDGDDILVDRTPRPLRDGVHVVRLGDALHVKRVQGGRPGQLTLISANDAYPPIDVSLGDVEVIGRVVWKSGKL